MKKIDHRPTRIGSAIRVGHRALRPGESGSPHPADKLVTPGPVAGEAGGTGAGKVGKAAPEPTDSAAVAGNVADKMAYGEGPADAGEAPAHLARPPHGTAVLAEDRYFGGRDLTADQGNGLSFGKVEDRPGLGGAHYGSPRQPILEQGIWLDRAGNEQVKHSADVRAVEVPRDMTPPALPVIEAIGRGNLINAELKQKGVLVTGYAESGAVVEVKWGDSVLRTSAGPDHRWSVLFAGDQVAADGSSTVVARAGDAAGNASGVTTRYVLVDTAPPSAPGIDVVAIGDVISAAERDGGVTVSGSAEIGSVVAVVWGGVTREAAAGADGRWSVRFEAPPVTSEGMLRIEATAMDRAGNASAPGRRDVRVDTRAPDAPTIAAVAADDIVNAAQANAGFTVEGNAEAGAKLEVSWQGVQRTITVGTDGHWVLHFDRRDISADGEYVLFATATDAAGNKGAAASRSVLIDTHAPAVPLLATVAGDDMVNAGERDAGVAFSGTAEAGSTVEVRWGAAVRLVRADDGGAWHATFARAEVPADGPGEVFASSTDRAGNKGLAVSHNVLIDTLRPEMPQVSLAPDSATGHSPSGGVTADDTPALFIGLGPHAAAGDRIEITSDGMVVASHLVTGDEASRGLVRLSTGSLGSDGSKHLSVVVTDHAGNKSLPGGLDMVLQRTAPASPLLALADGFDTGASGTDGITNIGAPQLRLRVGAGSSAGDVITIACNGQPILAHILDASEIESGTVILQLPDLGDGLREISATARDAAGHVSAPVAPLHLEIDRAPPSVPTVDGVTAKVGDIPVLTGTAALQPGEMLYVTVAGATYQVSTGTGGHWRLDLGAAQPVSGALGNLTAGAYDVSARAIDRAGNQSTGGGMLSVADRTAAAAPTVVLVNDLADGHADGVASDGTVTISGEAGAVIEYQVDGAAWTTWGGSLRLGEGVHSISVRQTDAAGNLSPTASYSFEIDQTAPDAPVVTINDGGRLHDDGITNDSRLNIGGAPDGTLWYRVDEGDWSTSYSLTDGDHVVHVRRQDAAGNFGPEASVHLILDTHAPDPATVGNRTLASTAAIPTLNGTANLQAGETLEVVVNGATYAVVATGGTWTLRLDEPHKGTLARFEYGSSYDVVLRVEDVAGNRTVTTATNALTFENPGQPTQTIYVDSISSATLTRDGYVTNDSTSHTVSGHLDSPVGQDEELLVSFDGRTWQVVAVHGDSWTVESPQGLDGSWTFQAVVRNRSRSLDGLHKLSVAVAWDATPPGPFAAGLLNDTGISGDNCTSDATISVQGEAGAGIEYFDGTRWSSTYNAHEGVNTVGVRLKDAAGNATPPAWLSFTLDTVAPAAPSVENVFSNSTAHMPDLTGRVSNPDGEVLAVKVTVNGATYDADLAPDGNWTVDLSRSAASGTPLGFSYGSTYRVDVTVSDLAGNSSTGSGVLTVSSPGAPTQTVAIAWMSNDSNIPGDFVTNVGEGQTYSLLPNRAAGADEIIQVWDGSAWQGASWDAVSGVWAWSDPASHTRDWNIKARVYNVSTRQAGPETNQWVTLDTTAPPVPRAFLVHDLGESTIDGISTVGDVDILQEPGAFVEYQLDGGRWNIWTGSLTLPEGAHTMHVRQTDAAGNRSPTGSYGFEIESTAPHALGASPLFFEGGGEDSVLPTDRAALGADFLKSNETSGEHVIYSLGGDLEQLYSQAMSGVHHIFGN